MLPSVRPAVLALASMMAAASCSDPTLLADTADADTGATLDTTTGGGGPWPISTVTGATLSDGSSAGSGGASDTSSGDDTRGEAIDEAPTIELRVNGSADPAAIVAAGTQTITASVADDRGLARVEIFVDEEAEAFAAVTLAGSTAEVVEVALPITDDVWNGAHSLRAVVHDDAMQATESAAISLEVELPEGGSEIWASVSASKFASKALAVAVDSVGDVIAIGEQSVSADGTRSRMMIRKYHGETGEVLWQREVPTQKDVQTPLGQNIARGVTVDAYDNVYVVGEVDPDGDSKSSLWLGKYTFEGLLAGTHVSDEPRSRGNGVAVDDAGRVFVAGYRQVGNVSDARVEAFNANLSPLWSDTVSLGYVMGTRAYGAAIDRHGDLVVVGSVEINQVESRGLIGLYTADGAQPWTQIASSVPHPRDRLFSVVVTEDNEYVMAGRREAEGDPRRLWLLRLSDQGDEIASEADAFTHCGDPNFNDDTDVCGVAVGPIDALDPLASPGSLFMAGVGVWGSDNLQVKKTRSEWAIHLWAESLDGTDQAIDRGLAVAADADGYVTAAGYETHLGLPRWRVTRRNP